MIVYCLYAIATYDVLFAAVFLADVDLFLLVLCLGGWGVSRLLYTEQCPLQNKYLEIELVMNLPEGHDNADVQSYSQIYD